MNLERYQRFSSLLNNFFRHTGGGAITLSDGQPLHIEYENLADIGTLPRVCSLTQQYLKLLPEQIALTNDPYSGGTVLSTLTLITPIHLKGPKDRNALELLLAHRLPLRPKLADGINIDDQGLRIPPSPIVDAHNLNEPIINAIAEHPNCPDDFKPKLMNAIAVLQSSVKKLPEILNAYDTKLSKHFIKQYLDASYQLVRDEMQDFPLGEKTLTHNLTKDEVINLRCEYQGKSILFDFSGTTASASYNITDSGTLGSCLGVLLTLTGKKLPLNAGTFRIAELQAPAKTIVNAEFPAPTTLGMTEGIAIIANMTTKVLGQMNPRYRMAQSGVSLCAIDLQFSSGEHFYDTVPGGIGASDFGPGSDGINMWVRNRLQPSIEDIETRFPMQINKFTRRNNSGGKGQKAGGDGITKTYRFSQSGIARWRLAESTDKAEGIGGGTPGAEPIIYYTPKGGTRQTLDPIGKLEFQEGDTIAVLSPGGGALGAANKQ
jgi:N-methylhydantoinase B